MTQNELSGVDTLFIGLNLLFGLLISGAIVILSNSFTAVAILIVVTITILEILGGV
ncbi:MAG: hypothetical protein J07HQX50_01687 [Haloquadratum sp. J07HQX50]|nr:MAG: hypothetical protein J07HQX50_01687 [Haloquadratum sp. J07HQX50]